MDKEFMSPRWLGRLIGLLVNIAKIKGVRFAPGHKITLLDLLQEVGKVASNDENYVISSLMKMHTDAKEHEQNCDVALSEKEEGDIEDMGTEEADIIFRRDLPLKSLLEHNDILAEEKVRKEEEAKKAAKTRKIVWSCVAAIVLGIVIYNLPYFQEMRYYNKVKNDNYTCESYYSRYPDGRYYEDVMLIEMQRAQADNQSSYSHNDAPIKVGTRYLHKFPNGKYASIFNYKCDSLWDAEIAKYNQRDKSKESPEAVKYITAMLDYMKTHRVNSINLRINSDVKLKDYTEYNQTIRNLLEALYKSESLKLNTANVLSLKENFTSEDESVLVSILAGQGLEKSFGRMFSSDFVSINKSKDDFDDNAPDLNISYVIKNIEEGEGEYAIPNIWSYSTFNSYTKARILKAYILGVDVRFEANFSIPGSSITYKYSEVGKPGNEISNIDDIRDGYRRMTAMCFAKFANKMADNLGLEEMYFRNDDDDD